jgi:hypothetical protein
VDDLKTGLEGLFQTFIDLTSKLVLPDWNDVVTLLLPIAVFFGLVAPILTILVLYWAYQTAKRPPFRVRTLGIEAVTVPRDEAGQPVVPANVPYCSRDGLLFPPRTAKCSACGDDLTVRCPVDGTLRTARLETCSACGTRYILGASDTALAVRRSSGPPRGGAAVA